MNNKIVVGVGVGILIYFLNKKTKPAPPPPPTTKGGGGGLVSTPIFTNPSILGTRNKGYQ